MFVHLCESDHGTRFYRISDDKKDVLSQISFEFNEENQSDYETIAEVSEKVLPLENFSLEDWLKNKCFVKKYSDGETKVIFITEYFEEELTDKDVEKWHEGECTSHIESMMKECNIDSIQIWGTKDETSPEPLSVNL